MRALRKAIELTGGRRALAERLGVKSTEIDQWAKGKADVPREAFLRLVELILDDLSPESGAAEPSEPGKPPPRASSAWSPPDGD